MQNKLTWPAGSGPALVLSVFAEHLFRDLHNAGREMALNSGATQPVESHVRALEEHARARALAFHLPPFDPSGDSTDRILATEHDKTLADRRLAEQAEKVAGAVLMEKEVELSRTPEPKPPEKPLVTLFAAALVLAFTIAPTAHDFIFHAMTDDLMAWFLSLTTAAAIGVLMAWAILGDAFDADRVHSRTYGGLWAGITVSVGLCFLRLSGASELSDYLFALGLTATEVGVVAYLEWVSRESAKALLVKSEQLGRRLETQGRAQAARQELDRRAEQRAVCEAKVAASIAALQERHARNFDLVVGQEAAAHSATAGYFEGIAENNGMHLGMGGLRP
jgi:hypothetical protein